MKATLSYWRGLVARAASIETFVVTQFTDVTFAKWLGQATWYAVRLGSGSLVLCRDGQWRYASIKHDNLRFKKTYAHRTPEAALASLKKAVAPDEPACSEIVEIMVRMRTKREEKTS